LRTLFAYITARMLLCAESLVGFNVQTLL